MEKGIANGIEGWGSGEGIQYDMLGKYIGEFENPRPIE